MVTEKKINILVIEDNEDDALLLLRRLKKEGLNLNYKIVKTWDELKKNLADGSWDIILSDFNLPGYTGLDAFELYKGNELDIPFIIVSGKIGEEAAVEAMRLGINDYVMKDSLGRLAPAIDRELREAEMRKKKKSVELDLSVERKKFESLVKLSPMAIAIVSNDGQIKYLNPTAIHMFGYTREELPTIMDFIDKLYPDAQENKWVKSYFQNEFNPTEANPQLAFPPVVCNDGTKKHIKIRSGPLDTNSFFLNIEDITIERLATQALEENQKRLSQIIQNIDDSIFEIKPDDQYEFIIISANVSFFNTTKLNFDQVYGAPVDKVFKSSEYFMKYLRKAVEKNETFQWEDEISFGNQHVIWDMSIVPIYSRKNKLLRIVCSANDITERKKSELRLRESEVKFRTIAGFVSDAIWEWDIKNDIVWWNEGISQLFGYEKNKIENTIKWWKTRILDHERDKIEEQLKETFINNKSSWTSDFRFRCADDTFKHVHNKARILYDEAGEPDKLYGAMIDETSRIEQEELRLQSLIEGADNERSNIARELHDSLGQILTLSHIKLKSLIDDTEEDKKLNKKINDVEELAERSIQITRNMTHNLIPKALLDFGLVPALNNLVEMVSANAGIHIDLYSNFEETTRLDRKVEINLYRISQEALSNAVKHGKAEKVDIQLNLFDNNLNLMIEDNGQGFDVKKTKEKAGMGLENIRNRVLYLNGEVDIESQPGRGTLINLDVPV